MKLNLWCMWECYSADIYCKAFYRQNDENFLEGQINGRDYFGGAPKRMIFDNAKVAVREGFGVHFMLVAHFFWRSTHFFLDDRSQLSKAEQTRHFYLMLKSSKLLKLFNDLRNKINHCAFCY